MNGSFVTDLGLSPVVWLLLSLLGCVTLFFKFGRFWSVRNLDLVLLFVLVPGMLLIVGNPGHHPWSAYIWLFIGSGLWLLRCVLERFSGGPVGLSTLAVALGEEAETIEDVYEPYLLQLGFLQRTPRGRIITELGREHLGAVRDSSTLF